MTKIQKCVSLLKENSTPRYTYIVMCHQYDRKWWIRTFSLPHLFFSKLLLLLIEHALTDLSAVYCLFMCDVSWGQFTSHLMLLRLTMKHVKRFLLLILQWQHNYSHGFIYVQWSLISYIANVKRSFRLIEAFFELIFYRKMDRYLLVKISEEEMECNLCQ